jgi:AbrB family looped-hinge helix DNA binding protein
MKTLKLKMDSQGRILIPKILRDAYDLKPDTDVFFLLDEHGIIIKRSEQKEKGATQQ